MVSSSSSRRRSWLTARAVASSIAMVRNPSQDYYSPRRRASGSSPPQAGEGLMGQPLERRYRDIARHAGRAGNHVAEVEAEGGVPAEALASDVGRAGEREPVDE